MNTTSISTASTSEPVFQRHPGAGLFMPRWRLTQRQVVPRPLDEVFEFFADAENLERLTPSFLGFEITSPRPIDIRNGAYIEYSLRLWGLPVHWLTVIQEWSPPRSFVDVQRRGPYRRWRHLHRFQALDESHTLVEDQVDFELPGGPFGTLAFHLLIRRSLRQVFEYRAEILEQLGRLPRFGSDDRGSC